MLTSEQESLYEQLIELYKGVHMLGTSFPMLACTSNAQAVLRSLAKQVEALAMMESNPFRRGKSEVDSGFSVFRSWWWFFAGLLMRLPTQALRLAVLVHALRECTVRHGCVPSLELESEEVHNAIALADYFMRVRLASSTLLMPIVMPSSGNDGTEISSEAKRVRVHH
jgi:hypothetical protein